MKNLYSILLVLLFATACAAHPACPTSHTLTTNANNKTFIKFNHIPCKSDSIYIDTTGTGVYDLGGVRSGKRRYKFSEITGNPFLHSIKFVDCNEICQYNQSLPIELIDFQVNLEGVRTRLQWRLAMQENLENIVVRRNGKVIEVIENTITDQLSWTFYDENPTDGMNYYQLDFVDFDGENELSNIVAVRYDAVSDVTVNKTIGEDTFTFKTSEEFFHYQVVVFDMTGKLISQNVWDSQESSSLDIDLSYPGLYIVSIFNGVEKNAFKLTKL